MNIGKGASLDKRKNKERGTALVHRNIKKMLRPAAQGHSTRIMQFYSLVPKKRRRKKKLDERTKEGSDKTELAPIVQCCWILHTEDERLPVWAGKRC